MGCCKKLWQKRKRLGKLVYSFAWLKSLWDRLISGYTYFCVRSINLKFFLRHGVVSDSMQWFDPWFTHRTINKGYSTYSSLSNGEGWWFAVVVLAVPCFNDHFLTFHFFQCWDYSTSNTVTQSPLLTALIPLHLRLSYSHWMKSLVRMRHNRPSMITVLPQ